MQGAGAQGMSGLSAPMLIQPPQHPSRPQPLNPSDGLAGIAEVLNHKTIKFLTLNPKPPIPWTCPLNLRPQTTDARPYRP